MGGILFICWGGCEGCKNCRGVEMVAAVELEVEFERRGLP